MGLKLKDYGDGGLNHGLMIHIRNKALSLTGQGI